MACSGVSVAISRVVAVMERQGGGVCCLNAVSKAFNGCLRCR